MNEPQLGYFMTQPMLDQIIDRAIERFTDRVEEMLEQMTKPDDAPCTLEEFQKKYHVCATTIRNWARDGIVKIEKKGRRAYVTEIKEATINGSDAK